MSSLKLLSPNNPSTKRRKLTLDQKESKHEKSVSKHEASSITLYKNLKENHKVKRVINNGS